MLKRNKILLALVIVPLWIIVFTTQTMIFKISKKDDIQKEILITRQYYNWNDMTYQEKMYYSTAIEILCAFSKLNVEQRNIYIKENKKVADLMGINPWWGFAISKLETDYDIKGEHEYGEVGIDGIKFRTALQAETYQNKFVPDYIKRKIPIKLKSKKDLLDIRVSCRVKYTLIADYLDEYDGYPQWAISKYHWGGFIAKHWRPIKKIPEIFTLDGIEYGVINYFLAWENLIQCFSKGNLEPVADIMRRYKKTEHKIIQAEFDYRRRYKIFKGYEKRINKLEKKETEYIESIKELKKYNKEAIDKMNRASKEAKAGGGRKALRKSKQIMIDFLNKIKGKK